MRAVGTVVLHVVVLAPGSLTLDTDHLESLPVIDGIPTLVAP